MGNGISAANLATNIPPISGNRIHVASIAHSAHAHASSSNDEIHYRRPAANDATFINAAAYQAIGI